MPTFLKMCQLLANGLDRYANWVYNNVIVSNQLYGVINNV